MKRLINERQTADVERVDAAKRVSVVPSRVDVTHVMPPEEDPRPSCRYEQNRYG